MKNFILASLLFLSVLCIMLMGFYLIIDHRFDGLERNDVEFVNWINTVSKPPPSPPSQ